MQPTDLVGNATSSSYTLTRLTPEHGTNEAASMTDSLLAW